MIHKRQEENNRKKVRFKCYSSVGQLMKNHVAFSSLFCFHVVEIMYRIDVINFRRFLKSREDNITERLCDIWKTFRSSPERSRLY